MASRVVRMALIVVFGLRLSAVPASPAAEAQVGEKTPVSLWDLAQSKRSVHRFSTLFTAQQVRDHLSTEDGIGAAIDWCRKTAVTKVYIESFRDGYQAERKAIQHAKERFLASGFQVSGCVTTTQVFEVAHSATTWRAVRRLGCLSLLQRARGAQ